MSTRTLAQARVRVATWLDSTISASGTRWVTTEVTSALGLALSRAMNEISKHTDAFDLETTGTTSASDGSLSISSVVPLRVKKVAVVTGGVTYELPALGISRRGIEDEVARSLLVTYVREYALPSDESHPLVGVTSTGAASWLAFDDWICAMAALDLAHKDSEGKRIASMTALEARCRKDALAHLSSPAGTAWPRAQSSPVVAGLAWQYKPSSTTLYLVRAV